ncbi:HD domain-containing protein [Mycobacterium sp. MYCO198283]|uniref:HD domain-containing protein n=1 Tax=Mycobacterium sp. MYCO198283 TaxID=2883505 RepID=UPI001E51FFC8|nr:HD domain-containing protein [Mycobacterium sp. MYCO198283]MCG5431941.1 HD domain-containing protein [Mycobacterium sp. MYCO198283]
MTAQTTLTERFRDALVYAEAKHRAQTRKGGTIPYVGHLLSVAGLVIEAAGTEDQAIAALLHDAAEDQGGEATLAEIRDVFGDAVATIVRECSDTVVTPKPPWRQRKQHYIDHLGETSEETLLVSTADKLDNARSMVRDYRRHGDALWERFTTKDPQDHLWYYRSLLTVYRQRSTSWLADDLERTVDELEELLNAAP